MQELIEEDEELKEPTTALPLSGGYPLLMPRPLSLTQTTLKTLEAMQRR